MAQQDSVETLDHDDDPQSQSQAQAQANDPITSSSTTTTTTCDSDPRSLSRNLSSSRLNAKAPEFVPSSSSSATAKTRPGRNHNHHQSRVVIPPPPQPSPTGLVHVYNAPNSPYHVPIVPVPVPVQHHHPYPHPHHPIHYHQNQNQNHHNHHRQFYQEVAVVQPQQQAQPPVDLDPVTPSTRNGNGLTDEATQKIISQVEYYFSDVNLATTDHLMRFINKDPEGCVPISVVASFKKIKTLISSNSQLATILRNSAKLVVSEDGKKVRRQLPLTESDMEELQSRIVVAENLPEDHCYQNLMKIFSSVGSVKTIRTCQPQTSNGGASSASRTAKAEGMLFSNKLHAFVEYESVELAEKAVSELNEEGNWRNGLRVRLLLRRTTKPTQARVKKVGHEGEAHRKEDDTSTSDQQDPNEKQHLEVEDPSQLPEMQSPQSNGHAGEEQANGKEVGGQKKSRSRGRAKGRGRQQYHHNHRGGHHVGPPPSSNSEQQQQQQPALGKQQPPGPRMPDGTRGFSLGRGKPIAVSIA